MIMRKRIVALLLMSIFLVINASCSVFSEKVENKEELSIYVIDFMDNVKLAIDKFNKSSKNIEIKAKIFSNSELQEFEETLKNDLAEGKAPDIVVAYSFNFDSLSKYMEKGAFSDLNQLIAGSKEFKMSDYNQKVLDYGVYKGKRYIIPLNYTVDAFFTTKEIVRNDNINFDGGKLTLDKLSMISGKYTGNSDGVGRKLISNIKLSNIIRKYGDIFTDMENKTAKFYSDDFGKLLQTYKGIHAAILPEEKQNITLNQQSELLKENKLVMLNNAEVGFGSLTAPYSAFDNEVQPVIYPYGDVESTLATPALFAGINSNCQKKEDAFEFIKLLLSKDMQTLNQSSIPVNNEAYAQLKESFLNTSKSNRKGGCKEDVTLETLISEMDSLISNINVCKNIDGKILNIVEEEAKNYINGVKTVDEVKATIQKKTQEYFNSPLPHYEKSSISQNGKSSEELKLYYINYNENLKNSITEYKKLYPNIKISDTVVDYKDATKFREKLFTELMAGGGSDVIYFGLSDLDSLNKIITSGVFLDLNSIAPIEKDQDFADYNKKLLDFGIYNGKRYFLPVNYYFSAFYTTEKIMAENNIKLDLKNLTWGNLGVVVKEFMSKNKDKSRYFFDSNLTFRFILKNCEKEFIDYKNKKTKFDSNEFKELLKVYKEITPAICPQDVERTKAPDIGDEVNNNLVVMSARYRVENPFDFLSAYTLFKKKTGEDMIVYPVPSFNGSGEAVFRPAEMVAVNSKCKNKEAALNFIKVLVSKDMQKCLVNDMQNITYAAVNKKAFEEDWALYSNEGIKEKVLNLYPYGAINAYPFSKKTIKQMESIFSDMRKGVIYDNLIYNIIEEEVKKYVDGKATLDNTVKAIDEKVTLYLNE